MMSGVSRRWITQWSATTILASLAATILDAILLQRRRSFFTGGFLSVDSAVTWGQRLGFASASLIADAAVTGIVVMAVLWAGSRLKLARSVSSIGAWILALAPIAAMDFVTYQLQTFLGDAFDLRLMFDLAGRSPAEFLAVGAGHLSTWLPAVAAAAAAVLATLWYVRRSNRRTTVSPLPAIPAFAIGVTLLTIGATVTATIRLASDPLDNGLRRKPSGQILGAIVEALSDVDRDGYGLLGRFRDADIFNPDIHPYALDIPGNGVDEDGVGGDLPPAAPYVEVTDAGPEWRSRQSVILIALESFRFDAFGAVVNGKKVTPALDALAASGAASAHAYSHNGYTVQSRHHFFSGSLADLRGGSTLLDDFKNHGYETAYFSGQDESFGGTSLQVGFDRADVAYDARQDQQRRYSTFTTAGSLAVPYDVVLERVSSFLKRRAPRPLFLYVNFHDTHFPYHHPSIRPLISPTVLEQQQIIPPNADALRLMYLNTAANVDWAIGELLSQARSALHEEPAVVVLSDHGESLFDEGFLGHGYALNEAQTQIPLVASGFPLTLTEPFGQVDLRDAIREAQARNEPGIRPRIQASESKEVFQYLGDIARPAQIASTTLRGRTIFDFRSGRVQIDRQEWRRPEQLDPRDVAAFHALIYRWERMMLAQHNAKRP